MSKSPHDRMRELAHKEWRKLGFFVDLDTNNKNRLLIGSYRGLMNFCQILSDFINDPKKAGHTASGHYGPYANLRIMTHDQCGMDMTNIHGKNADLKRLYSLVESALDTAIVGDEILIREEYHPRCDYGLLFIIKEDGFDPASLDPEKWAR